jgi:hypothetical protein
MSSTLRSTTVPVGYFVMSRESLIDGSGAELFNKVGNDYVYDGDLWEDLSNGKTFTWRDLGVTQYGADVSQASLDGVSITGANAKVDLRKVQLVSGLSTGVVGTNYDGTPRWVPLGTRLKTSTPFEPAVIPSSVFLVGKVL